VETSRIADLLAPFLATPEHVVLTKNQLNNISMYIDILCRWNARVNLTAIRQPDEIVTRHFGESLFAAKNLFPVGPEKVEEPRVLDVGSGAGFPGLPMKIWSPSIQLTLIESNHKKAAFLREVCRALSFHDVEVFNDRAENFPAAEGDVVSLRAVEKFESTLSIAKPLVAPNGRLALLIGQSQVDQVQDSSPTYIWKHLIPIPQSSNRVLMIGRHV
jgi:16S rRNA (guanine527-N7)-methyltransferase